MRYVLFAVVVLFAALIISDGIGRDADIKLAIYQADAQAKLDSEQREILSRLEMKGNSDVSEFVRDWRVAYPSASAASLQELRVAEQKINLDAANASRFTLSARQRDADRLNDAISVPFGGRFEARPGI